MPNPEEYVVDPTMPLETVCQTCTRKYGMHNGSVCPSPRRPGWRFVPTPIAWTVGPKPMRTFKVGDKVRLINFKWHQCFKLVGEVIETNLSYTRAGKMIVRFDNQLGVALMPTDLEMVEEHKPESQPPRT